MDENNATENARNTDGWLKTIADSLIPDIDKTGNAPVQSAFVITSQPEGITGELLGSGHIVGFLGEGGMARVYKTWNERLEMHRSVKVLLPGEKKELSDRFLTEARITARLNHPNIVSVFEFGEWRGSPFIEMEYIDGMSLDKLLQSKGPFSACIACTIGIFITRALSYAHIQEFTLYGKPYKGIIHRDLKPSNIMVDNNGGIKLMDFGIARPISTGFHTTNGNIVGTLPYLSPEQLNNENVDHRTDIYAIGAILYELLCGNRAFPDQRLTDLINKKENGTYIHLSGIPVSIPPDLIEIVDTCLKVNKADRYPDAETLAEVFNNTYNHYTCERPEIVLKNFINNPGYTPPLPACTEKNKQAKIQPGQPKSPSSQIPRFHPLRLPKPRLPKLHFLQSPKFPDLSHLSTRQRTLLITGIVTAMLVSATGSIMAFTSINDTIVRTVRGRIFALRQMLAVRDKPPGKIPAAETSAPATISASDIADDTMFATPSFAPRGDTAPESLQELINDSTSAGAQIPVGSTSNIPAPSASDQTSDNITGTASAEPSSATAPEPRTRRVDSATNRTVDNRESILQTASTTISAELLDTTYRKAVKAMRNGKLTEAFDAITKIPDKDAIKIEMTIGCTEKCLEAKDVRLARRCIGLITTIDARVCLLRGKVLYAENRTERALVEFEKAMNLSIGIQDAPKIKSEILFRQAECYETLFRKDRNDQTRQKAKKYWNKVLQNDLLKQKHYFARYRLENLDKNQN